MRDVQQRGGLCVLGKEMKKKKSRRFVRGEKASKAGRAVALKRVAFLTDLY